ncbi:MAG: aminopeptidase [Acholeplasmataceae bacterium]
MKNFNLLFDQYARLAVCVGANVQKDQMVVIRSSTESSALVRKISEHAYLQGAKKVTVQWSDDYVSKIGYDYMSLETLEEVPQYLIDQTQYFVDQGAAFISVVSPIPGLNKDVDPTKMRTSAMAMQTKLSFFQQHLMGNNAQWTIVASSNPIWAEAIFPNLKGDAAVDALWKAIFDACRVTEGNDPIEAWEAHNHVLEKHNQILNNYNFKTLKFKNSLGTDLTVQLVENHVWAGGGEKTTKGVYFNPNIPTEETFTMPYKWGTEGKVVASKPLNYQGKIIKDFWMVFKDGKVVEFDALHEKETLKNIIEFDENSGYIGEIALISHDSPISNTNLLFLNTLFDENASCHMALGRAYPMNIKNGIHTPIKELEKVGYNQSMVHCDFMFGSADMTIVGQTHDGKEVLVFENGNFVI